MGPNVLVQGIPVENTGVEYIARLEKGAVEVPSLGQIGIGHHAVRSLIIQFSATAGDR